MCDACDAHHLLTQLNAIAARDVRLGACIELTLNPV
jgi:hypothetical protein